MPVSLFDNDLDSKISLEVESAPIPENSPFRILMLGDWGGNSDFSDKSLSERKPIEIDRDEFDDVMRKIRPEVKLKFNNDENNVLRLTFENLDDFHPDNIFQHLPLFSDLKNLRQKLKKPDTFNEAAREIRSWYNEENSENKQDEASSDSFEQGNILDRILDNNQEKPFINQSTAKSSLSEFVGNIVAPHIVKTDFEEQFKLLMIVDEVISDLMRNILHHKDFQKLEAAWRGLYFLVRRAETDSNLKISLIHITKDELFGNLSTVNSLSDSIFYKWLVKNPVPTSENESWAVVFGNYEFSPTVEDTAALLRIAKIAEAGNCPFISQITPHIFGFDSFNDYSNERDWKVSEDSPEYKLWSALRFVAESSFLGLAIPRFLGRLPYGAETDPIENFSFEEFSEKAQHGNYLWLNPCFAYAYALASEYTKNEWNINQNQSFNLEDLPLHLYQFQGNTEIKPCAEIVMSENAYDSIIQQGLMALISFKNTDKIRLSALRSISANSSILKGKWIT